MSYDKEKQKIYRATHVEETKKAWKEYYIKNREKLLKHAKEYQKSHKEVKSKYNKEYGKKYRETHKDIAREYIKRYGLENKKLMTQIQLHNKYGMSLEDYYLLLDKQERKCAICGKTDGKINLAIDHNHETGVVRGLLCRKCNTGLGFFLDSTNLLQKAKEYLEKGNNGINNPGNSYLGVS